MIRRTSTEHYKECHHNSQELTGNRTLTLLVRKVLMLSSNGSRTNTLNSRPTSNSLMPTEPQPILKLRHILLLRHILNSPFLPTILLKDITKHLLAISNSLFSLMYIMARK